jgi:membrane associated rhomboid family serine protease
VHVVLGALIGAAYVAFLLAPRALQTAAIEAFAVIPARFQGGPEGFHSPIEALGPLFGHVFLHWVVPIHVMMNLLVYFQVAGPLEWRLSERGAGALRFLAFFFGSAAASAVAYILINPHSDRPAIGASGAICGLFAGYLLGARRNWRDALADPEIRRAAFWFLAINVGLMWFLATNADVPIAWEAHLGGFLGGAALFPLLAPKRRIWAGPWD